MKHHFKHEDVFPHDIFHAEHYDFNGYKVAHYFYCVYSQKNDRNNKLFRDVIGLMITTKNIPGYTIPVKINGRVAYVCCDNEIRFISDVGKVKRTTINLTDKEHKAIKNCYKKIGKEKQKQMKARY